MITIVFAVADVIKKLRTVHVKIMSVTKIMDLNPILNLDVCVCRDEGTRRAPTTISCPNQFPEH